MRQAWGRARRARASSAGRSSGPSRTGEPATAFARATTRCRRERPDARRDGHLHNARRRRGGRPRRPPVPRACCHDAGCDDGGRLCGDPRTDSGSPPPHDARDAGSGSGPRLLGAARRARWRRASVAHSPHSRRCARRRPRSSVGSRPSSWSESACSASLHVNGPSSCSRIARRARKSSVSTAELEDRAPRRSPRTIGPRARASRARALVEGERPARARARGRRRRRASESRPCRQSASRARPPAAGASRRACGCGTCCARS